MSSKWWKLSIWLNQLTIVCCELADCCCELSWPLLWAELTAAVSWADCLVLHASHIVMWASQLKLRVTQPMLWATLLPWVTLPTSAVNQLLSTHLILISWTTILILWATHLNLQAYCLVLSNARSYVADFMGYSDDALSYSLILRESQVTLWAHFRCLS
jgi:hypothetical protein